jgi:hypothetical protein
VDHPSDFAVAGRRRSDGEPDEETEEVGMAFERRDDRRDDRSEVLDPRPSRTSRSGRSAKNRSAPVA